MNQKTKILVAGFVALLVFGMLVAVNAAIGGIGKQERGDFSRHDCMIGINVTSMNKTGLFERLWLPKNVTRDKIQGAFWNKQLEDLGLTENSTLREYRQALEAKMQADREERNQKLMEKLSLSQNATTDEITDAMKKWREENKELLPRGGIHLRHGNWRGMGHIGVMFHPEIKSD